MPMVIRTRFKTITKSIMSVMISDYQFVALASTRKNRHKPAPAHSPEVALAHSLAQISARFLRVFGLALVLQ